MSDLHKEKQSIYQTMATQSKIEALQADNKLLKEFARNVIMVEVWGLDELDGCELQELAERLGLIESYIATEADVDEESDFEVGDKMYKFSQALQPDKEASSEPTR